MGFRLPLLMVPEEEGLMDPLPIYEYDLWKDAAVILGVLGPFGLVGLVRALYRSRRRSLVPRRRHLGPTVYNFDDPRQRLKLSRDLRRTRGWL